MAGHARGVVRVLEKLETAVKKGNYYEAHQMYRTLFFRYMSQEKYADLMDMLYSGALLFLDHDQQNSGSDLGVLLVDVLTKANVTDYSDWSVKLCRIFAKMTGNTTVREAFLVAAIRWSANDRIHGYPLMNQTVAKIYWNEKNYQQARHHYLHSKDGHGCAKLLIEFQTTQGYSSEVDLFIAQAVLQFLCLRNKQTANLTFASYTKGHPGIKRAGPPYLLPLLNFLWFLLQAIESKKFAVFIALCQQYEPSIKRDPCYKHYLDKIGLIFFDMMPPTVGNGLLGNFMRFLGGLDEDSDEEMSDAYLSKTGGYSAKPSCSKQPVESADLD